MWIFRTSCSLSNSHRVFPASAAVFPVKRGFARRNDKRGVDMSSVQLIDCRRFSPVADRPDMLCKRTGERVPDIAGADDAEGGVWGDSGSSFQNSFLN
ncbi:MAG: hypothetical protein Q7J09_05930 [Methanocalculus sp.]|uniref:hypothetical protein n=1 Tax=Methanocalculus sp. TaxID=2004547 RepID=UPI002716A675|nr:hypothetical protein [Methanocalculus sp.]MDO9539526.1 hypothetical protein [Methanocalculus sp.]